jgi:excisionase family DNA binding protein
MSTSEQILDPSTFSDEEREALREQIRRLHSKGEEGSDQLTLRLTIGDQDPVTIRVPESAASVLTRVLSTLAEGRPVSVAAADEELTTREAAELLNVSRPHLTKLLKEGEIPSHKVGSHHRVRRCDVLAYKAKRRREAEEAMQALTRKSQQLGLGY